MENLVTLLDVDKFEELLRLSQYSESESQFLVNGFRHGFCIGYEGNRKIQCKSHNLRLRVGSEAILSNKIMKEVKLKRFAGPFENIPYEFFMQSPVGLVPKDNGKDTRLIFHLSFPRDGDSPNSCTPKHLCSVKYKDFSEAIRICMKAGINCRIGKTDFSSAFRQVCIRKCDWKFLILMARSLLDGKIYYFVDKCLPFGASISCTHFQRFSDAVAHIVQWKSNGHPLVNYLDDYLFARMTKWLCDQQMVIFMKVCEDICFPVSQEKTF